MTINLIVPTDHWRSLGDKESFFVWLYSISGYQSCEGKDRILYISFSAQQVDVTTGEELWSLFKRYEFDEMRQLAQLKETQIGEWFSDPKMIWYDDIFG